jgi:hypothetical protein
MTEAGGHNGKESIRFRCARRGMEIKVFESPGQEWDEFASQYTDLIFYQSLWSEVLKKGLGGQPLYFYLKEGGRIVVGLPGVLLDFKFIRILYASIPYGNMIGEPSYFQTFMELLSDGFHKKGIGQVRMTESPFLKTYQPTAFQAISAKCSLLDLREIAKENDLINYRSEVRRAIRKAQKSGLYVKPAASVKEVEVFYRLYLSSMERNCAAAKYPLKWFYALYEILIQKGKADILLAKKGEEEYAAGVFLVYSKTSDHYLHNGSAAAYLESRPNDLIVDYIIRKGIREGKSILDFMGSDPMDSSLLRFKEKWGSRSLDIQTYVGNYHPLRCKTWELGKKWANSRVGSRLIRMIRH